MKYLLAIFVALASCQTVGESDYAIDNQGDPMENPIGNPEDNQGDPMDNPMDNPDDNQPQFWLIVESAKIFSHKVETADYLPDPWVALFNGGDLIGESASCDMETYNPFFNDHVAARTTVEWLSGTFSVVLYDYELEPSGNNWIGACVLEMDTKVIEHGNDLMLKDCTGAIDYVHVSFEYYEGEIDKWAEMNPNC